MRAMAASTNSMGEAFPVRTSSACAEASIQARSSLLIRRMVGPPVRSGPVPALSGLFVPLVTPFDDRDKVDVGALERLAVECLDGGAAGLVALATTAEASSLDEAEHAAVLQTCTAVCADRRA